MNSYKPLVIGVSGISRSGKNTFCDMLRRSLKERHIEVCNLSFAHALREDVEDFLKNHFNFNVWLDVDKEKFRPFLVWYANLKRKNTNGQYFIDKLKEKLYSLKDSEFIFTISDLRFAPQNYRYDELNFCQQYGPIVHIRKYKIDTELGNGLGDFIKVFDEPPNEFEAQNDPIIRSAADYNIEWLDLGKENLDKLQPHIDDFIDWLVKKEYIKC